MDQSIFSSIVSYTPTPYVDPKENFLTELFAWIINNVNGFAKEYVSYIDTRIGVSSGITDKNQIWAATQITVLSGYIDMVLYTDSGINYICEHKVDSELSENQIQKYVDCQDELEQDGKYYTVLLTKAKWQHSQKADASITWSDVDGLVENIIDRYQNGSSDRFVLEQFSRFLKEKKLGKVEPMDANYFKTSYIKEKENVARIDDRLKEIFKEIANYDWNEIIPGIADFRIDDNYNPNFGVKQFGPEWGRIGISFFNNWEPGIFAGILYDYKDHKLEQVDPSKGPDFVVLLDITRKYNDTFNSFEWTKEMKARLSDSHEPFDVFVSNPKNKWRLAVLQKPFYDVIKDATTAEEQIDKIVETIKAGVELFIGNQ